MDEMRQRQIMDLCNKINGLVNPHQDALRRWTIEENQRRQQQSRRDTFPMLRGSPPRSLLPKVVDLLGDAIDDPRSLKDALKQMRKAINQPAVLPEMKECLDAMEDLTKDSYF